VNIMTRFLAFFIAILFPLTLPASADVSAETGEAPVLIELFASQNCHSRRTEQPTLRTVSREDPHMVVMS